MITALNRQVGWHAEDVIMNLGSQVCAES